MKTFSKDNFVSALLAKDGSYTPVRADRIFNQLERADDDIQAAVSQWLDNAVEPAIPSIDGWDVARLKSRLGKNTLAALLTIDWLRKEPQQALSALKEGIK